MQEKLEKKVYVSFITNCQACFSNVERTLIFILDRENDIVVVRLALFTSRFFPLPSRTNQRNVNLTSVV